MSSPLPARRLELAATDDARVAETRRRLLDAFRRAASDPAERATVARICRLAGVSRGTFYTHFATVADLAVAAVTESFAAIGVAAATRRDASDLSRREAARRNLTEVVAAAAGTIALFDRTSGSIHADAAYRSLVDALSGLVRPRVEADLPGAGGQTHDLTCAYIAGGLAAVLAFWSRHPKTDEHVIVEQLLALLPAFMVADPAPHPGASGHPAGRKPAARPDTCHFTHATTSDRTTTIKGRTQ